MEVKSKRSQVWVETVIYLLIGLAIMGILLAVVRPAIEEKKDQIIIEQSLDLIKNIENKIEDVTYYGVGNSRNMEINIKRGRLAINPSEDYLEFIIDSRHRYSEIGENISEGNIIKTTIKKGEGYEILLKLDYSGKADLKWKGEEKQYSLQKSPTPYRITISNKGVNEEGLVNIDFS